MSLPIFNLGLCCSEQSKEIKVAISHVHPRARNTLDVFVCVEEERSERERAKKERRAFGLLTVLWSASLASLYMKQRFGRRYRSLFSPLSFSYIETKAPLVLVLKWKKKINFSLFFSHACGVYILSPIYKQEFVVHFPVKTQSSVRRSRDWWLSDSNYVFFLLLRIKSVQRNP